MQSVEEFGTHAMRGPDLWWLLVALALAPDFSMVGYLAGSTIGAAAYDAAHTYSLAVALAAVGLIVDAETAVQLG